MDGICIFMCVLVGWSEGCIQQYVRLQIFCPGLSRKSSSKATDALVCGFDASSFVPQVPWPDRATAFAPEAINQLCPPTFLSAIELVGHAGSGCSCQPFLQEPLCSRRGYKSVFMIHAPGWTKFLIWRPELDLYP